MNILLDCAARVVVAHRGGSLRAPENTIEAMQLAVAAGADAIELDVQLSADGHVVVMHDALVDRTTDGAGPLAGMTLAQLSELDASARAVRPAGWSGAAAPCRIPTLDSVLAGFPEVPLIIEIKAPLASAGTRELVEKHGARNRCFVASFEASALDVFRGSGIPVGATRSDARRLLALACTGFGRLPEFDALFISPRHNGVPLPIRRLTRVAKRAGRPTHLWTINEPELALRYWRMGVAGIITDDVPAMLEAREALSLS